MDISTIFKNYNQIKATAKRNGGDEMLVVRIDRGLGVAQLKEDRPFTTSSDYCACPDFYYRGRKTGYPCKHMRALQLQEGCHRNAVPVAA